MQPARLASTAFRSLVIFSIPCSILFPGSFNTGAIVELLLLESPLQNPLKDAQRSSVDPRMWTTMIQTCSPASSSGLILYWYTFSTLVGGKRQLNDNALQGDFVQTMHQKRVKWFHVHLNSPQLQDFRDNATLPEYKCWFPAASNSCLANLLFVVCACLIDSKFDIYCLCLLNRQQAPLHPPRLYRALSQLVPRFIHFIPRHPRPAFIQQQGHCKPRTDCPEHTSQVKQGPFCLSLPSTQTTHPQPPTGLILLP